MKSIIRLFKSMNISLNHGQAYKISFKKISVDKINSNGKRKRNVTKSCSKLDEGKL